MSAYLTILQWALNFIIGGMVVIGKWGLAQKEKVYLLEQQALRTEIETNAAQLRSFSEELSNMRSSVTSIREKADRVETKVDNTLADFDRAFDRIEKVTDRLNSISERMLTKQDLQLILKVRGD